jgi:uncharacterized phage-like protein YoqJ
MNDYNFYKKACFTGYRPEKFPFKLDDTSVDFQILKSRILKTLESLINDDCKFFYSGMAMGFDIIAAETVLYFRGKIPNINLICVIPFEEQEKAYSQAWKNRYNFILQACDEVILLSKEYHNGCYQNRNKFMVDNSDYVVTGYDGQAGGTRNTLLYAQKKKRTIVNINTSYLSEFYDRQLNMNI